MLIQERIQEFVLRTFPSTRKHGFRADEKWLEKGLLDSLGILDLVGFIEKEFAITLSDEELLPENFESLSAVSAFVDSKCGQVMADSRKQGS
jgi:acyl carrier protein